MVMSAGEGFHKIRILGSGTGLVSARYWSGLVLDEDILLDAPPTVGIHLRRAGLKSTDIAHIFVTHLHADHAFGLVFLWLEYHFATPRSEALTVIGPSGIRAYVEQIYRLGYPYGGCMPHGACAFSVSFIEIDRITEVDLGSIVFRAVPMQHHQEEMLSFGYRLSRGASSVAYSGDTRMVPELLDLARGADVLVVECTNKEGARGDHLDLQDIRTLRELIPMSTRILVTHTQDVHDRDLPLGVVLARDFDEVEIPRTSP
jgi:ribonuclease BN (tRNA processing enzyme)